MFTLSASHMRDGYWWSRHIQAEHLLWSYTLLIGFGDGISASHLQFGPYCTGTAVLVKVHTGSLTLKSCRCSISSHFQTWPSKTAIIIKHVFVNWMITGKCRYCHHKKVFQSKAEVKTISSCCSKHYRWHFGRLLGTIKKRKMKRYNKEKGIRNKLLGNGVVHE